MTQLCKKRSFEQMDLLFYLGLITIPFDNLCFAPSSGWATVSPIIFFIYVCLNYTSLREMRVSRFVPLAISLVCLVQALALLAQGIKLGALIDGAATLVLGISFYLALLVRKSKNADFNKDARVVFIAYSVSFCYGIVRMLAMAHGGPLLMMFEALEARSYDRLAFSFTEPSFIGMHVYGVLFLFSYFASDRRLATKMVGLGLMFVVVAVAVDGSARTLIDSAVFAVLFVVRYVRLSDSYHFVARVVLPVAAVLAVAVLVGSSPRLQAIASMGVYADPSLASRFFRINACLQGLFADPLSAMFGYGMGNMVIPFQEGYDQALLTYASPYTAEVEGLKSATVIDSLFSMPIKVAAEYGLVAMISLMVYVGGKAIRSNVDTFVVLMSAWLYVQFDSYAFYTFWLVLYLIEHYDEHEHGVSYFEVMTDFVANTFNRVKR